MKRATYQLSAAPGAPPSAPRGVCPGQGPLSLFLFLVGICGCFFLAPGPVAQAASAAAETNAHPSSSRVDFSAFHLVTERNIFNPQRSERGDNRRSESRAPEKRVRRDSFLLLGTMSYEKGRFAFFDGSNSDYRKVLKPAETIAGFKITAVQPTCVRLETTNGQIIDLCVGMQMSKQEQEDWRVSEPTVSSSSSPSSGTEAAANGGAADDIVKRLLQRREQEGGSTADPAPPATPVPAPAATERKEDASSNSEADEVLKRLLQKREQELNK
jgi:hypothetical protein